MFLCHFQGCYGVVNKAKSYHSKNSTKKNGWYVGNWFNYNKIKIKNDKLAQDCIKKVKWHLPHGVFYFTVDCMTFSNFLPHKALNLLHFVASHEHQNHYNQLFNSKILIFCCINLNLNSDSTSSIGWFADWQLTVISARQSDCLGNYSDFSSYTQKEYGKNYIWKYKKKIRLHCNCSVLLFSYPTANVYCKIESKWMNGT